MSKKRHKLNTPVEHKRNGCSCANPKAIWTSLGIALLLLVALGGVLCGAEGPVHERSTPLPLRIVVMDPLSNRLACDCVAGYAQRD